MYDPTNGSGSKYRQIRAPMRGGIRHPSVRKNTTKQELVKQIHPLFFPDGMNCFGPVHKFKFDISKDVHGRQLMHECETVEDLIKRLRVKHLRCYLLAKEIHCESLNSDSLESVRDRHCPEEKWRQLNLDSSF